MIASTLRSVAVLPELRPPAASRGMGPQGAFRGGSAAPRAASSLQRTAGLTPAPSLEPRWRRRGFLFCRERELYAKRVGA
jgi:hypothetical protein